MALPSAKEIKKLADACRKAGILHFKSGDIEFTLAPISQLKVSKRASKQTVSDAPPHSADELSEEAAMFWSVGDLNQGTANPQ